MHYLKIYTQSINRKLGVQYESVICLKTETQEESLILTRIFYPQKSSQYLEGTNLILPVVRMYSIYMEKRSTTIKSPMMKRTSFSLKGNPQCQEKTASGAYKWVRTRCPFFFRIRKRIWHPIIWEIRRLVFRLNF